MQILFQSPLEFILPYMSETLKRLRRARKPLPCEPCCHHHFFFFVTFPTTKAKIKISFHFLEFFATSPSCRSCLQQVPSDPIELHQLMFKKGLTTSKEGASLKRPKRKAPDGSVKRELQAMKRALKRQHKARYARTGVLKF